MTATESRLLCDHCHGIGWIQSAAGKVACGECNPAVHDVIPGLSQSKVISSQRCSLSAGCKVVRVNTDCLFGEGRMLDFAPVQVIVHKASLKLVSQVRSNKLVHEIMDSDLLERHSHYLHDKPPRRLNGTEILPALSAKWAMTSLPERLVALVIGVRQPLTRGRMLLLAITRINGSYAGLEAISLVGLFERVDKATNLNFGKRDSNSDWHALPLATLNRAEILA